MYVRELAYGIDLPYATDMAGLRDEILMNSFNVLLDALRKKNYSFIILTGGIN